MGKRLRINITHEKPTAGDGSRMVQSELINQMDDNVTMPHGDMDTLEECGTFGTSGELKRLLDAASLELAGRNATITKMEIALAQMKDKRAFWFNAAVSSWAILLAWSIDRLLLS